MSAARCGEPLALTGKIDSNAFDLRALLASVGIEAPKTTDPQALGQVQLAATWSFDGGAMQHRPFGARARRHALRGKFPARRGRGSGWRFQLLAITLDIARYIPPTDPASEPFVLPTAALKALKFRGEIELEQATYADIVMKGVTLRLLLDEQGLRMRSRREV